MSIENADLILLKAAAKSLAHHFKKAAAYHEAMASHHEKAAAAHQGANEHHTAMQEDQAHEAHKAHHKAKASFHKTMAGHHEKMHKAHSAQADHHKAMAEAHAAGDTKKLLEISGLKEEDLIKTDVTPAPAVTGTDPKPAVDPKPADTPSAPSISSEDVNEKIAKAFNSKLEEAVNATLERLMTSDDMNKKMDQIIATKLLEKLGAAPLDTQIKTFPVPRAGSEKPNSSGGVAPAAKVDTSTLDPELAELCKVD